MNGTQAVAQRAVNADKWLVDTLAELAGISIADAQKAAAYYVKHRIVKRDLAMSRYQFSAGVFTEADVIRRAVSA